MTDLVGRLRAGTGGGKHWMDLHTESADTIEAQAERIRVLREALELIHGQSGNDYAHDIFEARAIARAVLEATK